MMTSSKAQIPEGWRLVSLGDVAEVVTGNTPPRDVHEYYGGNVPWVKPSDLASSRLVDSSEEGLTDAGVAVAKRVPQNCVLVSCIGTIGEVAISTVPLCFNQQINALIPNDLVWPPFLYWACSAQSNYLLSISAKTAVPILNKSAFSSVSILLPPLAEQQAIATVLDSIDEAIEGAEAVIAATEQLRDSLLHQLLTRGVPGWHTEWKDVPGLGTIPADWEVVWLGEVAEVTSGIAMGPHRVPRSNPRPYLTVANVQADRVTIGERRFMELTEAEYQSRTLRTGDVVLVEGHAQITQLGRAAIVPPEADGFTFQNHLFRARPGERCDAIFVCAYVNSGSGRRYFGSFGGTTSGLNTVSAANVKTLPLPFPPIREQHLIATALHGVDETITRARTERDGLQSLKNSTADALLTGRVRICWEGK